MSTGRSKLNDGDDDFVSFSALHTSAADAKKLRKAPRPAFTYWDYDPTAKVPQPTVSPAVSRNRDSDVVSGLNSRLKRLSADLSAPSGFDLKWRRKLKKNREQEAQPPATSGSLTRWKSTSSMEDYIRPSKKLVEVDYSSKRLGSKMEELRDLVTTTEKRSSLRGSTSRQTSVLPEQSMSAQPTSATSLPAYTASRAQSDASSSRRSSMQAVLGSLFGEGADSYLSRDSDPGDLYTSSFTVNVDPPLNQQERSAEVANVKPSRSADQKVQKSARQELSEIKSNIRNRPNEEKRSSVENAKSDPDTSNPIHVILERLRNPRSTADAVRPAKLRPTDDGSRAELAAFAAQIDELSLPTYVDRASNEDFWVRMAHNKGERAKLEQLVGHTFDRTSSDLYQNHAYPGFEYRTPELELFPAASLARRWTQDHLKTA